MYSGKMRPRQRGTAYVGTEEAPRKWFAVEQGQDEGKKAGEKLKEASLYLTLKRL